MENISKENISKENNNKEIENKEIIIKKTNGNKNIENNNVNKTWYIKYKNIITIIICILIVILFMMLFYYKLDITNILKFSVNTNTIDTLKNKDIEKLSIENGWNLETEIQKIIQKQNIYIQEKKI